jgi:hypothetical protein
MNWLANLACSTASLLCPFRVAHVSRLIGNYDITGKRPGWQAPLCCAGTMRHSLWKLLTSLFCVPTFPHELKPIDFAGFIGTTEVVTFQNRT